MSRQDPILNNAGAERAVLAYILQHGVDALIDIEGIIDTTHFYKPYAQKLFSIFKYLAHSRGVKVFNIPMVIAAKQELSYNCIVDGESDEELLAALNLEEIAAGNARLFAAQIYKLKLSRDAWLCLRNIRSDLEKVKGTEPIDDLVALVEDPLFQFTATLNSQSDQLAQIATDYDFAIDQLAEHPKTIVGIPTGFQKWDMAIGGGLRPGSVNVVGARAKRGKSFLCLNMAHNIAKLGIPVLYLDSELTREYQMLRLASLVSTVELNCIETGQFTQSADWHKAVKDASSIITKLPITHCTIAGHSLRTVLAIIRRWLVKSVGLNDDGTAKPCVVVYDYLKLMDSNDIKHNLAEYQVLGFLLSNLHDFAMKFKIPVLAAVQLNREGATEEGGQVLAQSDRILWFCSNCTILKPKSKKEIEKDPASNGNLKLVITDTRFGTGTQLGDYINIQASFARAHMTEGPLLSQAMIESVVPLNVQQGDEQEGDE